MKYVKIIAGLMIALGLPAAFGVMLAAAGDGYANQKVVSAKVKLINNDYPVVHVHSYHHTVAGIAAVAGVCGLAWVLLTVGFVAVGGVVIVREARSGKSC